MLVRKLPDAKVETGNGFTFTLSRKIGSVLAKSATDYVVAHKPKVLKADDLDGVLTLLAEAHDTLKTLDDLIAAVAEEIAQLAAAEKVFEGGEVTGTGPVVEAAVCARQYIEAIAAKDPTLEPPEELEQATKALRKTIFELRTQKAQLTAKREKLDARLRQLTLLGAAHKEVGRPKEEFSPDGVLTVRTTKGVGYITNHFPLPPDVEADLDAIPRTERAGYVKTLVATQLTHANRHKTQDRDRKRKASADRAKSRLKEAWK